MFNFLKKNDAKKMSDLCIGLGQAIWIPEKTNEIFVDTNSCYKFKDCYFSRWKIYDKDIIHIWFITVQDDLVLHVAISKRKETHLHYKNTALTLGDELSEAIEITKNYANFNSFISSPPYVVSLKEYGYL